MDGSSSQHDASLGDLFSLLSNDADEEARERVVKAMYDPEHPYSYLLRQPTGNEEFVAEWPPKEISPELRLLLDHSDSLSTSASWLQVPLDWKSVGKTLSAQVLCLVNAMESKLQLQPLPGLAKGTSSSPQTPTADQVKAHVSRGEPVIVADQDHWIHMAIREEILVIHAGLDSAQLHEEFAVEFLRDAECLLSVASSEGAVEIRSTMLMDLVGEANSVKITPAEG